MKTESGGSAFTRMQVYEMAHLSVFRVFSLKLICALCPKGKLASKEAMS
jgi:hypothetical protein